MAGSGASDPRVRQCVTASRRELHRHQGSREALHRRTVVSEQYLCIG